MKNFNLNEADHKYFNMENYLIALEADLEFFSWPFAGQVLLLFFSLVKV